MKEYLFVILFTFFILFLIYQFIPVSIKSILI